MRLLFLSFILFICFGTTLTLGQEVKLNVITFNPCNSTYENELLVHLVKDGRIFQISDTLGTIHLPEPGRYKLKVFAGMEFYRIQDSVKFITISRRQNYDTLTRTTILDCINTSHGPDCGYFCCEKLCDGYNVDYFDNGKKKLEGHFKNGFPVGQLIFYNSEGRKKEIHYYDKSGNGRLIKKETVNKIRVNKAAVYNKMFCAMVAGHQGV